MTTWFTPRRCLWLLGIFLVGAGISVYFGLHPRVVLYCAQDQEFADEILGLFRRETGLEVTPKFDTEANKSVSLYTELVSERRRPRCDVFWNNEILSTIRLQRKGLLDPYDSPPARSLRPFPASAFANDHAWHAFATRARVLLVNTKRVKEADRPRRLADLTHERFRNRVVMAKPEAGTSATQAACLFEVLGTEQAKAFYLGLRQNGVQIVKGNKQAAESVGAGAADVALTDTDDAFGEIKAGCDVVMIYPDRDGVPDSRMGTLYIPNTVSILKNCPDPAGARRLVDFLLSAEVEGRLAESESHQIPFNPEMRYRLPKEIELPPVVKAMEVDFARAADLWDEAQTFLRDQFARPLSEETN